MQVYPDFMKEIHEKLWKRKEMGKKIVNNTLDYSFLN